MMIQDKASNYARHPCFNVLPILQWLDTLLEQAVELAQGSYDRDTTETDPYRGLYITPADVRQLLARAPGHSALGADHALSDPLHLAGDDSRLAELARTFGLVPFTVALIVIALAPEVDLRYERLYAFLQDDVTKRRPSVNLALNLLCTSIEEQLAARQHLAPGSPLLHHQLLHLINDPTDHQPPLLSRYLKVDERIVNYLFGADDLDPRLLSFVRHSDPPTRLDDLLLPTDIKRRLVLLTRAHTGHGSGLMLYLHGPQGTGKQTTAQALCREVGANVLIIDGEHLLSSERATFATTLRLIKREATLQRAAIYWEGFDALLADDQRALRDTLLRELLDWRGLVFLAGNTIWEPADLRYDIPFVRVEFPRLAYAERIHLWTLALDSHLHHEEHTRLRELASKFRFGPGQIHDAAVTARNLARWRNPEDGQVTMTDLYTACRLQSNRNLSTLARKITPHYTWHDIILPTDRMQQLREICNYVAYRALVYDEWGFDRKLSLGKGLNVLFAGPSGTGKTMAAEIIAGELELDLYKIDLSTVVSKYIGETEKNLSRIFAEAETSNAILFFDEADALFGKRSEVRDSHDRYANIEIGYLLQRMEEYEGVVILATNLRKNMDDAFVRRMHFAVEFPFPSQRDRYRIWEAIWPGGIPRDPGLDLAFMARRFEIAGGNIRNIALTAAFLAAADGGVIGMPHLIRATQREYQKMGKVVAEGEFGEYASLGER